MTPHTIDPSSATVDFTLFEATPGMRHLFLPDAPRFTIGATSKDLCQYLGLSRQQLVGKGIFEAFPPNESDKNDTGMSDLLCSLQQVLQTKAAHTMPVQRYDVQDENGYTEKYWQVVNTPFLSPEGEVLYIIHSTTDITKEVMEGREEERVKGLEIVNQMLMQAPVVVGISSGKDHILEAANEAALTLWDKTPDILGKPLREAIPEFNGQHAYERIDEVYRTGIGYHELEAAVTTLKDGKERIHYFDLFYQPYFDKGVSQAKGVFTLSNEVTDRVLAKKKVEESEAKYRTLFETMDQGYCIIELLFDPANKPVDYRFLEVNPVFETQTGLQDAVGKTMLELVPNIESHWIELYGKVALTGEPIRFIEDSTAMGRWFEVFAFRIGGEESRQVALLFTDVSERKKAEEALRQSETNLRNMILQAPIAMGILRGPQYVVEIANERLYELWGRGPEELLGKSIFEGLPEVKGQGYEELLNGVYTTGETFTIDVTPVTVPREGGIQTIYINLLYEAFREGDGTISGIMVVATDITNQVLAQQKIEEVVAQRTQELAKANAALQQSNQSLSRSNSNLGDFAYAASHDLKEPIRKIHVFADRLKDSLADRLNSNERMYFERMGLAAKRMNTLIEDLLTYSEVSQDMRVTETVDINEVIQQVLSDLDLEIEQKGAAVTVSKLFSVQGHTRQLQQAFHNLIGNALKYSKPGVPPLITIDCTEVAGTDLPEGIAIDNDKAYYQITVKDNGIGFDQADANRIFNVFTRLHGMAEYKGTGVGLSIVRKIIENHGGIITAESHPDEGATFKVLFPIVGG
jgi:PAS domain S-box-containing protein